MGLACVLSEVVLETLYISYASHRGRSRFDPRSVYMGLVVGSGTWTGSCPSTAVFSVNIIPPRRHTYFHLGTNAAPTRRTNEQCSFGSRGVLYSKNWHFVKRQTSCVYSNKSLWQHTIRTRYPLILNRARQLQKTTLACMRTKSKLLCWHKKYK
jgi:hypothetical protein